MKIFRHYFALNNMYTHFLLHLSKNFNLSFKNFQNVDTPHKKNYAEPEKLLIYFNNNLSSFQTCFTCKG